jgi:phosphoglycolate phosphatase
MQFKLLIFDWDGTLVDSQAHIVGSFQNAINDVNLPERSAAEITHIVGLSLEIAIATLFPDASPQQHSLLAQRYRQNFFNAQAKASPLFPGVVDSLYAFRKAGYYLAVATGKSRQGLNRALAETELITVFHSTRTADETCSKPNPQMLHELMDELAVLPSETLMIGDTDYDLQMAQNAGVASVAVTYGMHDKSRLLPCKPLICIDSFSDIQTWLSQ